MLKELFIFGGLAWSQFLYWCDCYYFIVWTIL